MSREITIEKIQTFGIALLSVVVILGMASMLVRDLVVELSQPPQTEETFENPYVEIQVGDWMPYRGQSVEILSITETYQGDSFKIITLSTKVIATDSTYKTPSK